MKVLLFSIQRTDALGPAHKPGKFWSQLLLCERDTANGLLKKHFRKTQQVVLPSHCLPRNAFHTALEDSFDRFYAGKYDLFFHSGAQYGLYLYG